MSALLTRGAVVLRNFPRIMAATLVAAGICMIPACQVPRDPADGLGNANTGAQSNSQSIPKPTVKVDATVQPAQPDIAGDQDPTVRPLAAVVDDSGIPVEFVEDELILVTSDAAQLDAFLKRWQGVKISTYDPAQSGLTGEQHHLVKINTALADRAMLQDDLARMNPNATDNLRVSSEEGAGLLGAAAREIAAGANVGINFIFRSEGIADRNVREDATGTGTIAGEGFDPNPNNWSYFRNTNSNQKIGVGDAWAGLERAGRLGNKVYLCVIDGGFFPTNDMPDNWEHRTNSIHAMDPYRSNEMGCGDGNPCLWHGMNATCAMAGKVDNGFGAAGPAGPVCGRLLTIRLSGDVFNYIGAFGIALTSSARIVNMSFSARVPATLTPSLLPFDRACAAARAGGMLLFAAAGNENSDVDAEDCFDPCPIIDCEIACWEEAWWTPAENSGVIAVGALAPNSQNRAAYSNWGAEEVDIFGPGTLWVGPDPEKNFTHVYNGTSAASPFVAGVAALVWAANPGLSDDDVERILYETAHTSPDGQVRRYVDASAAVRNALGGNYLPYVKITGPSSSGIGDRGFGGNALTFSCEGDDLDGGPLQFTWSSDRDGVFSNQQSVTHTLSYGRHRVTVTVRDSSGAVASDSRDVEFVNAAPRVLIEKPTDGTGYYAGQRVYFAAWSWDFEQFGPLPDNAITWYSDLQGQLATGASPFAQLTVVGTHTIRAVVRDPGGAEATSSIRLFVQQAPANLPPTAHIGSVDFRDASDGDGRDPAHNNDIYVHVTLRGVGWDLEDGDVPPERLAWSIEGGDVTGYTTLVGESLTGRVTRLRVWLNRAGGQFTVRLTATDRAGQTGVDTVNDGLAPPLR